MEGGLEAQQKFHSGLTSMKIGPVGPSGSLLGLSP